VAKSKKGGSMASTVWRGFVTFGLVSIPVRLFRAARAERVSLRRLYRAEMPEAGATSPGPDREDEDATIAPKQETRIGNGGFSPPLLEPELAPVHQDSTRKGSGGVLEAQSLVKGYEYEKGRYVAIDPEDLKGIAPKTATEMQIEEFVNLAEVDPVYFETSYYMAPRGGGTAGIRPALSLFTVVRAGCGGTVRHAQQRTCCDCTPWRQGANCAHHVL
jgi:DNA end-binding protein Ku